MTDAVAGVLLIDDPKAYLGLLLHGFQAGTLGDLEFNRLFALTLRDCADLAPERFWYETGLFTLKQFCWVIGERLLERSY